MSESSDNSKERPVKPHGCLCPLHPFQLLSYLVFFFYAYAFYFVEVVALKEYIALAYVLAIIYSALFIAVAVVAIVATLIDPTDPTVALEREKKKQK